MCPLVQTFNEKSGVSIEEYRASQFFRDKVSGLWFPQQYEAEYYDQDGKIRALHSYSLDIDSFQLNSVISDKEFSIDIPAGKAVSDRSDESNVILYQAVEPGVLTLADGGPKLDKQNWLSNMTNPAADVAQVNKKSATWKIIFIIVNILFVILLIVWFLWRKNSSNVVLLLIIPVALTMI